MTCIVGVVDQGVVYMGGDSAGVGGYDLTVRRDRKVFRNGDFLIGCTSSFRMTQLLCYTFTPPAYDAAIVLERYLTTSFVDAVRECFKTGGYAQKDREQEWAGRFLVGFQGHLFFIDSDYQVGEALDAYDAVGCGADIAKGVLFATPDMQPRKRLELALKAAERHNAAVRAPFFLEKLEMNTCVASASVTPAEG